MTSKHTSHFTFNMIDRETMIKITNDIKPRSSCCFDGISMKLLKINKEVFIEPLLIISNQTLNKGFFPDKLKIVMLTPVYKKDNRSQFTNYWPILLLPVISEIFESNIYNQVNNLFMQVLCKSIWFQK